MTCDRAFGHELAAERPALIRFGNSLCKDRDRAEDLASETIARAWKHRGRFEPGSNLSAWLTMILRNLFLSEQRRKRWDGGSIEDLEGLVIPVAPSQEDAIHLRDAQRMLDIMPSPQVEALLAVALEGTYEEAAEKLGCQVGTIKSRATRGRDALKELTA